MRLSNAVLNAVTETMAACQSTVYTEERSAMHDTITVSVWNWLRTQVEVKLGSRILDVGCGMGAAMELFTRDGMNPVGLTVNRDEFLEVSKKFPNCLLWDMHEIAKFDNCFDGIWIRHTAEHSFMPYVLLRSAKKALKHGGWAYIELPGDDTVSDSGHASNVNHYAIMGKEMWSQLIERAGFKILDTNTMSFNTMVGKEQYFGIVAVFA
jgi:SAM-dependent methyltransferase